MKGVSEMALPYYVPQFWVKAKPKLQLRPHQHVSRLFLKTDSFSQSVSKKHAFTRSDLESFLPVHTKSLTLQIRYSIRYRVQAV